MNFALQCFICVCMAFIVPLSSIGQDVKMVTERYSGSKQVAKKYYVLKSNNSIRHGEYIEYFRVSDDEFKQIRKGKLEFDKYVKVKGSYSNGKQQGEWKEYSRPGVFKTQRSYNQGQKVGIWETVREKGQVIERFDHDKNEILRPIIHVYALYPKSAQDAMIEGVVVVSYQVMPDCSITDITISESLCAECDETALKAIMQFGEYLQKYGANCEEAIESQEVLFKLDY